ncbi:MAG: SsrA-binding protein SmpB [Clostridia bacterium]|nr:SsrA-binding protein SmpB [Clostridia bacterium]
MAEKSGRKIICNNKKAYHDYFVNERYEAGLQLFGTEVKSVRQGSVNLKDSFCRIDKGELYAYGIRISPYEKGNVFNRDPLRPKKLLMHRKEINKLFGLVSQKGFTLIPLSMYFTKSLVKIELGLCTGKKDYDKREDAARKDDAREIDKVMKARNRYDF